MCKTFSIAWIPVKAMGHRLSKSRGISGIIYFGSFNSSAALNYLIIYSIFNYFYVQSFTNISAENNLGRLDLIWIIRCHFDLWRSPVGWLAPLVAAQPPAEPQTINVPADTNKPAVPLSESL